MTAARSLTSLLACLALMASPAAAQAQGAGDDQYQDPFADTPSQQSGQGGSGGSRGSSHSQGASGNHGGSSGQSGGGSHLSDKPAVPLPATSAPTATEAPTATAAPIATSAAAAPVAQAQLPRTGADPRLLALAGLALVLVGLGLRLRTADEPV